MSVETTKDNMDDLTPTGQKAVARAVQIVKQIMAEREAREAEILKAVQEVKTDVNKIRQMKEEERQEKAGIKAAIKRVWRAVVAAAKDLEQ